MQTMIYREAVSRYNKNDLELKRKHPGVRLSDLRRNLRLPFIGMPFRRLAVMTTRVARWRSSPKFPELSSELTKAIRALRERLRPGAK